ncbi:hypothetical protein GNI_158710, partial [Gregarina niphandrodes]
MRSSAGLLVSYWWLVVAKDCSYVCSLNENAVPSSQCLQLCTNGSSLTAPCSEDCYNVDACFHAISIGYDASADQQSYKSQITDTAAQCHISCIGDRGCFAWQWDMSGSHKCVFKTEDQVFRAASQTVQDENGNPVDVDTEFCDSNAYQNQSIGLQRTSGYMQPSNHHDNDHYHYYEEDHHNHPHDNDNQVDYKDKMDPTPNAAHAETHHYHNQVDYPHHYHNPVDTNFKLGEFHNETHGESHNETYGESHNETYGESHNETYGESHNETYGGSHNETYDETYGKWHDKHHYHGASETYEAAMAIFGFLAVRQRRDEPEELDGDFHEHETEEEQEADEE